MMENCIRMNLTFHKIASNLNVSTSTAQRLYTKFKNTGHVDPKIADRRATRRLDDYQELHILGLILYEPSLYLGELCQQIHDIFDLEVSPATICNLIWYKQKEDKAGCKTTLPLSQGCIHGTLLPLQAQHVCMG